MAVRTGYIGTYSSPQSRGVYQFALDTETGALTAPVLFYEARNMKCVALSEGVLAAPVQREDRAGIVLLAAGKQEQPLIGELCCEKRTSCFIAMERELLATANFHEGLVLIYRRSGGSLELVRRVEFGEEAGCHQVLLHGQTLLVPCMNLDKVALLDAENDFAEVGSLQFAFGAGPRHGIFDRAHRYLYIATQFGHEVHTFAVEGGGFERCGRFSIFEDRTVPDGAETAAVRLAPDGRFLYVSTRGANVITVFAVHGEELSQIQQVSCGGDHPRDFILSPDGRFLLSLNRGSGNLVSFPLDMESGRIGEAVSEVEVWQGSGLVLE